MNAIIEREVCAELARNRAMAHRLASQRFERMNQLAKAELSKASAAALEEFAQFLSDTAVLMAKG